MNILKNCQICNILILRTFLTLNILTINLYANNLKKIKKNVDKSIFSGLKTFSETTALLRQKSLRNIDLEAFVDDALKYGIAKIDPHSSYIKDYNQICETISGNFSGIGVSILNKNNDEDFLQVIDVIDESPAQKVGIFAGDKIIEISGQTLKNFSADEVISKIRGERGSKVKLKILRGKHIFEVDVPRETINDKTSLGYHFPNQNIYFVSLKTFTETAPKQMRDLIQKINEDKGCRGLILDLRSNPGGIMEAVVEITSLFVPQKSLVVSTKNKANQITGKYQTNKNPVLKSNIIIFVLINNFTASAAEILAGALKFYSKEMEKKETNPRPLVFLLGTTTFGKGSVQEVIPLSNNRALKITTQLYFLPNDKSVQEIGVKPDFLLMPTRQLSNEEKFMHELFGKEKAIRHHITQEEIKDITKSNLPEKHSIIDKKTEKAIEKLEEERTKLFGFHKEEKNYEQKDIGDLLTNFSKDKSNETDQAEKNLELKRQQHLREDIYVQTSINMINFLHMAQKLSNEKLMRKKCKQLLRTNFALSNSLEIKKI